MLASIIGFQVITISTWKHFVSKLGLCDCRQVQRQCDNIMRQHDIVLTIANITKPA